ncbi:MAG: PaaI family thioesterase [Candidatus Sericytochromatia bacterium]
MKTINLTQEERITIQNNWNNHISLKAMGVRLDLSDDLALKCFIDKVNDFHRGGMGTEAVNGAVLSALFDLTIGLVGYINSNNKRTGTVQMNINFLRPLKGNKVIAEGKLIKKGKSLIFARAEVFDENNELCAFADGISSVDFDKPSVENHMVI